MSITVKCLSYQHQVPVMRKVFYQLLNNETLEYERHYFWSEVTTPKHQSTSGWSTEKLDAYRGNY
jgi:hypothetical protein